MTGSIAFALSFPALIGQRRDLPRAVVAPPSATLRTVKLPAGVTPGRHRYQHEHHRPAAAGGRPGRPAQNAAPNLASVRVGAATQHPLAADSSSRAAVPRPPAAGRPIGHPVAPEPAEQAPAPAPAPSPAPAAPAPPAAEAPPARELAQVTPSPPPPPAPVVEAPPPAPPADDQGCDEDDDDGSDDGHAFGHEKHDREAAAADSGHDHGHGHDHGNEGGEHDHDNGGGGGDD